MKITAFLNPAVSAFTLAPQVSLYALPLSAFNNNFVSLVPTTPHINVANNSSTNYAINEDSHSLACYTHI
jgi:hypothetical protein